MHPPATVPTATLHDADDRTLVAAFLDNRRDAFDVIVERHWRSVYRLCYRFVGNHEDASELAPDVFVREFKGLHKFKGASAPATWLHRVGVTVCLNRIAIKPPPCRSIGVVERRDDRIEDPLARLVRGERAAIVRAAIRRLPPRQRATLLLHVYRELPHEEIARILGRSVGTGKANLFHALGNLRRLLQPA